METGEPMRLLIVLRMQFISPAGGQKSNPAEPSIRRLKNLWKSLYRDIKAISGLSLLELGFLINCSCADLNCVPLNPTVSNIAPIDFALGYKQIPLNITMEGTRAASKAMDKLKQGYQELCARYKKSYLIRPYLWTRRKSGKLQRKVTSGDLVFVHEVNRIGQVTTLSRNQLKVHYKDSAGVSHEECYPKATLALLVRGNQLAHQNIPEGLEQEIRPVRPERGNDSGVEKASEKIDDATG